MQKPQKIAQIKEEDLNPFYKLESIVIKYPGDDGGAQGKFGSPP